VRTVIGIILATILVLALSGCANYRFRIGVIGNGLGVAWKGPTMTNSYVLRPGINITNIISAFAATEGF
jgi:hypothetical protein